GDREQFNQCQTQLETLYDNGCNRTHLNEFLIYRLLYSLLLNDYKKTNRILINIDTVKKIAAAANGKSKSKDIEHIDLALELFAPSFPIETITQMLAYESNDICQKHLSSLGITLIDEPSSGVSIDCRASRAIFEKK
ncbi:unnamed protein product, partial [Rotaria sordida]